MSRTPDVARKLLLVDDSEIVIESVRRCLKCAGYEVIATHSCAEARSAAKEHQFSGLIIDLELADGHGVDLARSLRQEGQSGATVFYTGESLGTPALEEARQFGRVVVKGADPRVLLSAVKDVTRSVRPRAPSQVPASKKRSQRPKQ